MNAEQQRLEPAFDFSASESNILLHRGKAEIYFDEKVYSGDGEIRLELVPRAHIGIYGEFDNFSPADAIIIAVGGKTIPSFSFNGRQVEGFTKCRLDPNSQKLTVKRHPNKPVILVGDELTGMTRVVFHLFNFVDLRGSRRSRTETHLIEHVDLTCDEWKVELKSLASTQDNLRALREEGGYRLTHIGSIERVDKSLFSGKLANEYLYALRFFLSFAKGGWCVPVCAVGFDVSGNRVWGSLASPKEPWHQPPSWFDPHTGSQLESLFPGFMLRWANDEWKEALQEVIYWYLNANNSARGIDAGIILTQAAIERLSYEFSVKDKRLLTVSGFKALKAPGEFRILFSSLGIPIDIPKYMPELEKLAKEHNWEATPQALTEIRNALVHPDKKRGQLSSAYYEAWNLGLRFLELAILAICDYNEGYHNRCGSSPKGMPLRVPWKKDKL